MDLLCEDNAGNLYIVELKKDSGYDDAYKQTAEYFGWFEKNSSKVYEFSTLVPSKLPEKAGVYVIWLKDTEEVLYVDRTRNMRQRLYTNHLMGNKSSARLKKYLIDDNVNYPEIVEYSEAKEFIKNNCCVQFVLIEDNNDRGHVEGLLGFLTDARYIEAEH